MSDASTIEAQREQIARLRQRIETLEIENERLLQKIGDRQLSTALRVPSEWRLSPREEQVFLAMLEHDLARLDFIAAEVYGALPDIDRPEDEHQTIKVLIHYVRKKVEKHGVTIRNVWGRGYEIIDRRAIRERLSSPEGVNDNSETVAA